MTATAFAAGPITLTGRVHDFNAGGGEFEIVNFNSQTPSAYFANNQNNKIERGIVGPMGSPLGANGLPVYSATREAGFYNTVPDANLFNNWFKDAPGVNVGLDVPITFSDLGGGMYDYESTSFTPIDNQGFGNQGNAHDYHFTIQLSRSFVYQPGQSVVATSDDDLWVFIDHKLAIDIGGIHGGYQWAVNLDSLGLTAGQSYPFDLFYAERNTPGSAFGLKTNILSSVPEPSSLLMLATVPFAGSLSRRRVASRPTRDGNR